MKVISFDKILEIKNKLDLHKNSIQEKILKNYEVSQKILRLNKKKNILSKINFDILLKPSIELTLESKYKNIMIALNKINKDNIDEISKELCSMKLDDFLLVYKLTDSILKKILNETNYMQYYFTLINNLSKSRNWCTIFNEKYNVNLKEAFILKLQETFENNILTCEKDYGLKLINLLVKLYPLKWIEDKIYDEIINWFLSLNNIILLEYTIVFIKNANYKDFDLIKERITKELILNTRLRFMLEEDD